MSTWWNASAARSPRVNYGRTFAPCGETVAKKLFDLAVKTGTYQDRASGQTKGRWQNVGAVMQGDDGGQFIMLARWFSPAGVPDLSGKGGESVLLSCFEPKQGGGEQSAHHVAKANGYAPKSSPADDEIPF